MYLYNGLHRDSNRISDLVERPVQFWKKLPQACYAGELPFISILVLIHQLSHAFASPTNPAMILILIKVSDEAGIAPNLDSEYNNSSPVCDRRYHGATAS